MITNSGFKILLNRAYNASPDYAEIDKFKVGASQATTTVSDTDLTKPIPISGTEQLANCETIGDWTASTDGSDSQNSTTYKEGSGALNLIKTGTTADNVTYYNNNNMTSLDFTDKDLWVWLYIKDDDTLAKLTTSEAVELRLGNDYDTNFYYKKFDNADLSTGWNYLTMNTTDGTETGSVTLASCDSGAVKITFTDTSDTLAEGDVIIDDWKLASSVDYLKAFETGYPSIDETKLEATVKCYLNSVQANGYNINSIGTFNEDTTKKMQDVFKFTAQSKSNTDELSFKIYNRLVRR